MRSFVLRIIVIERCSTGGFPLEEASEHCFLSIKVLFGVVVSSIVLFHCYSLQYFMFHAIIIDLVPYKWYQSTFLGRKLWVNFFFFRVEMYLAS
jgi:hypothetical protein